VNCKRICDHHLGKRTFFYLIKLFFFKISFDRTRNVEIGNKNFGLQHVEEAYTTEHWIVRIYKVKKLSNRVQAKSALRLVQRRKSIYSSSKKTSGQVRKQGVILNKPQVKKGTKVSTQKA
jgi:dolichyl-diphosphooligosaccharide--protein glycosyltransferase